MDKKLQLLGMARRAGKLAMGHDMALDSVRQGDAALLLLCSDVSDRLREEFTRAARQAQVPFISMPYPMDTLHHAT
ncbi:MAG: ribosomal L7Ae/L30e/S12e/Gadd45 family protein [Clostridiales bacterium]|nr:ribosomal L7Ae/L30e/S12e/Gadd45 family protein [Clostridiales bacterium]